MTSARIAERISMSNHHGLNGLILNGGASSRMGSPKGEIIYHNKSQHEHVIELLTPLCDAVYFSVKRNDLSFDYPQIEDQLAIESPLNGIYSALTFSSIQSWLVVPIDMPLLDTETLVTLIMNRDPSKVATCYYDSTGKRPEPLVSIWEPTSLNLLNSFIENDGFSPRTFLEQHDVKIIHTKTVDVLLNINSRQELERFHQKKKP